MSRVVPRATDTTSQTRRVSDSDYADWLTKDAAAAAIQGSTKMVERLAADGQIQQASCQRQGRGAYRTVYHPDDVARVAAERRAAPAPFVLPVGVTSPVNGNGHHGRVPAAAHPSALAIAAAPLPPGEDLLRQMFAAALHAVSETSQTSALFLTVDEAAVVAGLTPRDLRRAIRSGELAARHKDRRDWRTWRIRRKDLEAL